MCSPGKRDIFWQPTPHPLTRSREDEYEEEVPVPYDPILKSTRICLDKGIETKPKGNENFALLLVSLFS